jgi:hypothetical protein
MPGHFMDARPAGFQPDPVFDESQFASASPVGNEPLEIVRIADREVRPLSLLIERPSRTKFHAAVVIAVLALLGSIGYLLFSEWRAGADDTAGSASLKSADSNNGQGAGSPNSSLANSVSDTNGVKRRDGTESSGGNGGKTLPASYVKSDAKTEAPSSSSGSSGGVVGESARREVRSIYDQWVKSAVGGNWDRHLSFYADRVDYFRDGKLTRAQVKARKRRVFAALDSYSLKFTQSPQIRLRQVDGAQVADVRFDRQWLLKRNRKKIEGRAHGLITLRHEARGWRIISEKQIN